MTALPRHVLAIIAAAALTAGACACGRADAPSGASTTASPSTSTSASAAPTATATPTVTTAPSVDELHAKATAAVKGATSVVMTIVGKDEDGSFTIEERGRLDGSNVKRTMHESDGSVSTTIKVGDKVFIKANKTFWRGRLTGLSLDELASRWVTFAGGLPKDYGSLEIRPSLEQILEDWAPGAPFRDLAEVSVQDVKGVPSYRISADGDLLELVVDARTWLPMRFTLQDPDHGPLTTTFSSWDAVGRFTAPKSYLEVRLKAH